MRTGGAQGSGGSLKSLRQRLNGGYNRFVMSSRKELLAVSIAYMNKIRMLSWLFTMFLHVSLFFT